MERKIISAIVAGTGHEGRSDKIKAYCWEGAEVSLVREPTNQFDPNAIAVILHVRWMWGLIKFKVHIGYIKAARAKSLARDLDSGKIKIIEAWVESYYAPDEINHPRVSLRIEIESTEVGTETMHS